MVDNLTISYEEFPDLGIKVLTISRGDEALWQYRDEDAEFLYKILISQDDKSIREKYKDFNEETIKKSN